MNVSCHPFYYGTSFRWLSVIEGDGKWRMELIKDEELYIDEEIIPYNEIRHFKDHLNREWFTIYPRRLVLHSSYRWNGNTPKKGIRFFGFDFWFGTPDFHPGTIAASAWHDALFQFSALPEMPLKLWQANSIYHQLSEAHGAPLDEIYKTALKVCGSKVWKNDKTPGLYCIIEKI